MSDIMKITVISDTHGLIDQNIIPHLKNSDMIIHAGDIMNTAILTQLELYSNNARNSVRTRRRLLGNGSHVS